MSDDAGSTDETPCHQRAGKDSDAVLTRSAVPAAITRITVVALLVEPAGTAHVDTQAGPAMSGAESASHDCRSHAEPPWITPFGKL
ncbi:MAG: hypothetical protein ABJH68_15285 [Ilumatobacter sp.]|uniref:hypothetical protein n=1 Tax=Ilumatobacter sp. TaxID=1967498 RepID=UPI003298720B